MALKLHPDRNSKNPQAAALFKEVNDAYRVLSNSASRQAFHKEYLKHTKPTPVKTPAKKNSVMATLKLGKHLTYHLHLTFEEALSGTRRKISYMREIHGSRQSSTVMIDVPKGVREGRKLRVRGAGESANPQQMPGDLVVVIHLQPHPFFSIIDNDLIVTVPISPLDILLLEQINVPTPTGPVQVQLSGWEDIQNPSIRLKDRGFPTEENVKRRGDLFVRFIIEVPPRIDENLKEQLRKIKKALPKTKAQDEFEKLLTKNF